MPPARAHVSSLATAILIASSLGVAMPASAQQDDVRARAAEHFDRGIAFYEEGRYDAALAELARAYELAPAHQVLYNLARVHAALGHAVEAAAAYDRYLEEAGDAIGAARRREATRALEEQRARIGELTVEVDQPGATISVDGVDVATAPLARPLPLSAGSHTLEVRAPGHETARRAVSIAGRSSERIRVELREESIPRGTLRVETNVPDVAIAIDGEDVGHTPLQSTLPLRAGPHEVRATRPGYRAITRQVDVAQGAELALDLELTRDEAADDTVLGRVRFRLPNAPNLVRVDGEPVVGVELELPIGPHRVEIEVTDRRPYDGTIRVRASDTLDVEPALSWTLDARQRRIDAAEQQRGIGVGLSLSGAVLFAGSLGVLVWNETEVTSTDNRVRELNAIETRCRTMVTPDCPTQVEIDEEKRELSSRQDLQNIARGLSAAGVVIGTLLAVPGFVVWLMAPSEADVDSGARAALRVGPGSVAIEGAF
ncbi:MAG: PEGA domain-containing protein [Sandaracinaceae bacterium]